MGEAYQVLSNEELRAKYDKAGKAGLEVHLGPAAARRSNVMLPVGYEWVLWSAMNGCYARLLTSCQSAMNQLSIGYESAADRLLISCQSAVNQVDLVDSSSYFTALFGSGPSRAPRNLCESLAAWYLVTCDIVARNF